MSPKDTFEVTEKGGETRTVSYEDYFRTKYDARITDTNQPVLVSVDKRTSQRMILIPELCQMTGLTDSMRANFSLMKEMAQITNTDARRRVQECKSLIESFGKSEKCREAMQEWQMCIESDPIQIQGQKLAAGKMIMGKVSEQERSSFDIETCQDIDRKI